MERCKHIKCDKRLAQVCGSNGKTFTNECSLELQNCLLRTKVIKASSGPCGRQPAPPPPAPDKANSSETTWESEACPKVCPLNAVPVCGTDGGTYRNKCVQISVI